MYKYKCTKQYIFYTYKNSREREKNTIFTRSRSEGGKKLFWKSVCTLFQYIFLYVITNNAHKFRETKLIWICLYRMFNFTKRLLYNKYHPWLLSEKFAEKIYLGLRTVLISGILLRFLSHFIVSILVFI